MNSDICSAIRGRKLIRLTYNWGHRVVEPHAYGTNQNGHDLLRCYQTTGASESGQPVGWKLLRMEEVRQLNVLEDHFAGPRSGYRPNDAALNETIYCQI